MADLAHPEPRRHHFVPSCWLAGFTESGEKDGELWVTDLSRQKQWASNPGKAGSIRDFYRIDAPNLQPTFVETTLSKMEDVIAPLLKILDRERRGPFDYELAELLHFMAIQWARVPAFRPFVKGIFDKRQREELQKMVESKAAWEAFLASLPPEESEGISYEDMKETVESGKLKFTPETEWYIQRAFLAAAKIGPLLEKRYWVAAISDSGSFIASDYPVTLDGPKGEISGFSNAEVIVYPVSRHVLLCGTLRRIVAPHVNFRYIAEMNTLGLLRANEQVFSHRPDFCWADERRRVQTDWKLFSKGKY